MGKIILANDGIDAAGKAILEKKGFRVLTENVKQEDLIAFINEHQVKALLVRSATKVRKDIIDGCPSLEVIGRAGVGMDNIDVSYAREQGKKVINTPGASSQSVAELVFSHLFSVARFIPEAARQMPSNGIEKFGDYKKIYSKGFELKGKTLGIIGFGRIGQNTARLALGLGMNVQPFDPVVDEVSLDLDFFHTDDTFSIEYKTVSLEDVFKKSDFITVHVPGTKDGKALIGEAEIALMKDGVILVNTARGGVIDENALLNGLNSGKIAYACLDVFENEPTPKIELLQHPKVLATPHIGGSTIEAQERIGIELASLVADSL